MNKHDTRDQPITTPSVFSLISVHTVLLLGRCTFRAVIAQNSRALLFGIILFSILFLLSSLIHTIIYLVTRKRRLKNVVRIPLYFSPILLIMLLTVVLPRPPQEPNQTSPLVSPSQQYVMLMRIKEDRWRISLYDHQTGNKVYEDIDSDFVEHLSVYWIWDHDDRLWLFNSDDGTVYYWTIMSGRWQKIHWGYGHTKQIQHDIMPPETLYPPYAKKKTT